ncbi:MAG TPA: aldehyde dehydrogenase family protein [Phycisphaerales bacterium]|nr:aldehyde dehydrogenase family protein [Phycisphaerales bacterium]
MSHPLLKSLGVTEDPRFIDTPCRDAVGGPGGGQPFILSENPTTGHPIAAVKLESSADLDRTIAESVETFKKWREVPAPIRGQIVRAIGDEFRRLRDPLGELISLEMGKIRAEGIGEVQETIDIADYAVGLSRQLPGQVFPSERPGHRMFEQWLPLGPIGVISAFNFPNAVWAWNAMIAAVCGDVTIWKPSLLTPLTAIASNRIADRVATAHGHPGVFRLIIGSDEQVSHRLVADRRIPLISATGSCRMGRAVGQVVAQRLGRALLELGGNNAIIVHEDADLELAARSIVFGAVGTAGQRCTTTRRLIVHEKVAPRLTEKLVSAYKQINSTKIGDPLKEGTLVGPLINAKAVEGFLHAIDQARQQGGEVLVGGRAPRLSEPGLTGHFVEPTIIRAPSSNKLPISAEETFAPILYIFTYANLDAALAMHNGVDQGLSSAIFTDSVRTSERFLGPAGSDCGIANVNIGTSGAEIGGAFGGEKDTGGGRESGSDSWKAYMRRQTCTINHAGGFALAQGIRFE